MTESTETTSPCPWTDEDLERVADEGMPALLSLNARMRYAEATLDVLAPRLLHERDENARLAETLARVRRALDDELANLADDGARLSHSVVRRIEAALASHDAADTEATS